MCEDAYGCVTRCQEHPFVMLADLYGLNTPSYDV